MKLEKHTENNCILEQSFALPLVFTVTLEGHCSGNVGLMKGGERIYIYIYIYVHIYIYMYIYMYFYI